MNSDHGYPQYLTHFWKSNMYIIENTKISIFEVCGEDREVARWGVSKPPQKELFQVPNRTKVAPNNSLVQLESDTTVEFPTVREILRSVLWNVLCLTVVFESPLVKAKRFAQFHDRSRRICQIYPSPYDLCRQRKSQLAKPQKVRLGFSFFWDPQGSEPTRANTLLFVLASPRVLFSWLFWGLFSLFVRKQTRTKNET